MAFVYMRRKPALIIMLVLGGICVVDGPVKHDLKEFLVGLGTFLYAVISLISDRRKKLAGNKAREHSNSINPNR